MTRPVARGVPAEATSLPADLLVDVVAVVTGERALSELSSDVARLARRVVPAAVTALFVPDATGRSLQPPAGSLGPGRHVPAVSLGEGPVGWVASRHQPVVVTDVGADTGVSSGGLLAWLPVSEGDPAGKTAFVAVPVRTPQTGLVGVLAAAGPVADPAASAELLGALADLLAPAVHQARLRDLDDVRWRARSAVAEQMVRLQEAERRRMAADIHDGICQRLVSLAFRLTAAQDALPVSPQFAAEQLRVARELADLAQDEARAAITGLRPPVLDDLGLADGLESLARTAPVTEVVVQADQLPLPEHLETALFRIAQEAVQNVTKHANARRLRLELRQATVAGTTVALLQVADDGDGFVPAGAGAPSTGYGLAGMRERAELVGGRCEVVSGPGRGTVVMVTVPLLLT